MDRGRTVMGKSPFLGGPHDDWFPPLLAITLFYFRRRVPAAGREARLGHDHVSNAPATAPLAAASSRLLGQEKSPRGPGLKEDAGAISGVDGAALVVRRTGYVEGATGESNCFRRSNNVSKFQRLRKKSGGFEKSFCGQPIADGGDHDDRDVCQSRVLLLLTTKLLAVHYWHHKIEQNEVRLWCLPQVLECFLAVGGTLHLVSRVFQD